MVGLRLAVAVSSVGVLSSVGAGRELTVVQDWRSYPSVTAGTATVRATSGAVFGSAAVTVNAPVSDFGLLLLDPSSQGALSVTGSSTVTVRGGGSLIVNSTNKWGAQATGSSRVTATRQDFAGTPGYQATGSSTFVGTLRSNIAGTADPFTSAITSFLTPTGATFVGGTYGGSGTFTLQPGIYTNGILAGGAATVTLQPGVYYVRNNGFSVGGSAVVSGTGVTIVNLPGTTTNGVTVSGAGRLSLSAPTTGASAGFVIVQTPTSTAPLSVSGSGVASLRGVVDLPSAAVTVSGASTLTTLATASGYGRLIARSLTVSGSSSVVVDVTPPQGPGGNFQRAAIASGPVLASRSVPAGHAMMVDTSSRGGTSQGSRNKARGATPSGSVLSRVSLVKRGATGQAKKVRPASSKPASGASEMIAIPTDLVADVFHVKGRSRRG